jgi:hypothetical protein
MTRRLPEPIDLPAPVAAYFAADTTGGEAVAQCFTDGAVVIDDTGRGTGDFPGSPVDLQYRFTLEGDKIARLEIAP